MPGMKQFVVVTNMKINLEQLMSEKQPRNPLHGVTLERMLEELVADYGWPELGRMVNIRCFNNDPSIKSSLKFLRKTEWARKQVEELYLTKKHF
jgi:uncharacterized protein (DUF2132 family)